MNLYRVTVTEKQPAIGRRKRLQAEFVVVAEGPEAAIEILKDEREAEFLLDVEASAEEFGSNSAVISRRLV